MRIYFIVIMLVSAFPSESEIVRRWWAIAPGSVLPLSDGGLVQIVFPGHPGGSMGPDVHDAVLCFSSSLCPAIDGEAQAGLSEKQIGDVEFHIRASDWEGHQHQIDPRYNGVILHVVLVCDRPGLTIRQDGRAVPVYSLHDLPLAGLQAHLPPPIGSQGWPCHRVMQSLSILERDRLLMQAGLLRFEQKTHAFVEQLHNVAPMDKHGLCDMYDTCLIPALAEGLGYGRDRQFFRAAGLRLLGKAQRVPEPLGRALQPSPLDVTRLRVLSRLVTQWRTPGIWITLLTNAINQNPAALPDKSGGVDIPTSLQSLRDAFCTLGLSLARADILICNVVLPFAAAVALLEHDMPLYQRAQAIYVQHPGLSSNRITRRMSAQLLLPEEPELTHVRSYS